MPAILKQRRSIGGRCQHCRGPIASGEQVYKVDDGRARSWSVANSGPGSWVCAD